MNEYSFYAETQDDAAKATILFQLLGYNFATEALFKYRVDHHWISVMNDGSAGFAEVPFHDETHHLTLAQLEEMALTVRGNNS